jgi:Tol biopolymer transport system component
MRTPFKGGPTSVVLQGLYSYDCAASPSKICVLGEIKGNDIVFSFLDPSNGRGPEVAKTELPVGLCSWGLSPDGKSIALTKQDDAGIYLVNLETGAVQTLHLKDWRIFQSTKWAPDGRHIYFAGWSDTSSSSSAIVTTDLTGNAKALVEIPYGQGWLCCPVPSPDGRFLAYTERIYEPNVAMLENF